MVKTTKKYCMSCKYSGRMSNGCDVYCNYLEDTGKRRGCPIGYCDKYEKKARRTRRKPKCLGY